MENACPRRCVDCGRVGGLQVFVCAYKRLFHGLSIGYAIAQVLQVDISAEFPHFAFNYCFSKGFRQYKRTRTDWHLQMLIQRR